MMATILAAPSLTVIRRGEDGKCEWAHDLQSAINSARPGDVVQLTPGRYPLSVVAAFGGTPDAPVTVRGPAGGGAVLDGGRTRDHGRHSGMDPVDGDFAFMKLVRADHLVLENLAFENCWPTAIYIRACRNITIRNCRALGGRFFVYARQYDHGPTRDILLDRVEWVQDPDHDMWEGRVSWSEIKAVRGHFDASYFNGALFGSFDIEGPVTIRNCDVSHAFNAIRMDIRAERVTEGTDGPRIGANRNVSIHDNRFGFIRDNAIEPEIGAENWRVFNNSFFNVHAAFSFDGVALRDAFFVGNRVLNNRAPGLAIQDNRGGKILKFLSRDAAEQPEPRRNLWMLFNSVQTRTSYAKDARTRAWSDAGNAVALYHAEHPEITAPPRPLFVKVDWTEGIRITGLATNDATFPDAYQDGAAEVGGHPPLDRLFDVPDFRINADQVLGGWDGELNKVPALQALRSDAVEVELVSGERLAIPAGLVPGAQDVGDLGLGHWRGAAGA